MIGARSGLDVGDERGNIPTLGNYFVATYPPFSYWTEEAVGTLRSALETPHDAPAELGLYVHIPFCLERCHYCYYLSYDDRSPVIDDYLEALGRELRLWADTPAVEGRSLAFVYFGGGTPSLLSTPRLARLFHRLQDIFPWTDCREATFECAPQTVSAEKLILLRDRGITRLSLGVQQLDDQVLRVNGRVHLVADVERAYEAIRRVGFDVVNLDLIVGLVGETDESFFRSLDDVIAMAPESVTIYQLEIPHNTPLSRSLKRGELPSAPPSWAVKRARLGQAFARLEMAGYTVRSAYGAVRDPVRHGFVYQDEQYRGADLLGIGASAFSYLDGIQQQNIARLDPYLDSLAEGRLPLGRAYALTRDERLVREAVLQLKLGRIEVGSFRERYGVDVRERFAEPLARFQAHGWLEVDETSVSLTRAGLIHADQLVVGLYRAEHCAGAPDELRRTP